MVRNKEIYRPQKDTRLMLVRALQLVNSVPYQVSARWLFYRLLQEGYYSSKDDYANKFLKAVSAARHAFYEGWRPDTLADETREAIRRGDGFDTPQDWITALSSRLTCNLTMWHDQPYYVELWFEARAMRDQFEHYTQHLTLRPMGGQPSIPYKWETAKHLEQVYREYGKPIKILYFGDLDAAGGIISDTAEADVSKWCTAPFEFIRCGLTAQQVTRYNVPENIEKPGQYQWEALPDEAARDIITASVNPFVRHDAFLKVVSRQEHAAAWIRDKLAALIDEYPAA